MLIVSALVIVKLESGVLAPAALLKMTVAVGLVVLMLKAPGPSMVDKKLMLLAPVNPVVSTVLLPVATLTGLLKMIVDGPVPVASRMPLIVVAPFELV